MNTFDALAPIRIPFDRGASTVPVPAGGMGLEQYLSSLL